jgi:hypothetical protein
METVLAVIGGIVVIYFAAKHVLPIIVGFLAPGHGGKQLLKRYIQEQGYSPEMFPESFFDECVERDIKIAKFESAVFGRDEPWVSLFNKNIQGSAYQICAIMAGTESGFDEMRKRMEKYLGSGHLATPPSRPLQQAPPKVLPKRIITCWQCNKEIKETDTVCPYCEHPQG